MKEKAIPILVSVAIVALALSPFVNAAASLSIYGYTDKAQYKPGDTVTLTFWLYNDGTEDLILKNVTIRYPWYSPIWGGNETINGQDAVINPAGNWTTSVTFTVPNDGRAQGGGIRVDALTDKTEEIAFLSLSVASTAGIVAFENMDTLIMLFTFLIIITLICTIIIAAAIFLSARRPQVTWKAEQGQ